MSQQQLVACSQRLFGDRYLGKRSTKFDLAKCERVYFPVYVPCRRPRLTYRDESVRTRPQVTQPMARQPSASASQPIGYEITGVSWHTKDFINSCSIDGVLSAWIRKVHQTQGRFLRYIEAMDEVGVALIVMADYALSTKENMDSDIIKHIWLSTILKNSGESVKLLSLPVCCTGNTAFSVYQHLRNHCTYEIVSSCQCGVQYHRDFALYITDPTQLKYMVTPHLMQRATMPLCQDCGQKRILQELNPGPRNWLHVFTYEGTGIFRSPPLKDIPKIITLGGIQYALDHLTYIQRMPDGWNHSVSLHYYDAKFHFYDGGSSTKFHIWSNERFTDLDAKLYTIAYLKI